MKAGKSDCVNNCVGYAIDRKPGNVLYVYPDELTAPGAWCRAAAWWKIEPLSQQLDYSIISVRRFMAIIGYYSSFSHNDRWYTLASIPHFSHEGLWFYRNNGFSRAGSLTRTLVALVDTSSAGMTAEALGQKLRCRCHSVLVGLYRRGVLQRQRQGRAHVYLAADTQRAGQQRQAMALSGGYILHLDGLHQDDAPALMSGIDGLSRLVLANVKLPSEKAERIIPFLRNIQSDYGDPITCVHDMGTGICKAVNTVFSDVRDFIRHFHFLRDVGKDLLEPSYRTLRSCFRRHAFTSRLRELVRQARQRLTQPTGAPDEKLAAIVWRQMLLGEKLGPVMIVYALSLWCLQAKKSGGGYGFPFDRPLHAHCRTRRTRRS